MIALFQLGATITELINHYESTAIYLVSGHDETKAGKARKAEYQAASKARDTALQLLEDHQALIKARSAREWS